VVRFLFPKQFLEILKHGENQNEHRANQADGENRLQESDRDGDQQGHDRSLAFTSRSQTVPYELFTNFLARSYGLLALMQVDGCISMPSVSRFGMVIPIFMVTAALAVIFLVCFEIALLRDRKVPHVMYTIQFKDVFLDLEKDDQEEEPCWTLPLSA
jgi:hypothetical protein